MRRRGEGRGGWAREGEARGAGGRGEVAEEEGAKRGRRRTRSATTATAPTIAKSRQRKPRRDLPGGPKNRRGPAILTAAPQEPFHPRPAALTAAAGGSPAGLPKRRQGAAAATRRTAVVRASRGRAALEPGLSLDFHRCCGNPSTGGRMASGPRLDCPAVKDVSKTGEFELQGCAGFFGPGSTGYPGSVGLKSPLQPPFQAKNRNSLSVS